MISTLMRASSDPFNVLFEEERGVISLLPACRIDFHLYPSTTKGKSVNVESNALIIVCTLRNSVTIAKMHDKKKNK